MILRISIGWFLGFMLIFQGVPSRVFLVFGGLYILYYILGSKCPAWRLGNPVTFSKISSWLTPSTQRPYEIFASLLVRFPFCEWHFPHRDPGWKYQYPYLHCTKQTLNCIMRVKIDGMICNMKHGRISSVCIYPYDPCMVYLRTFTILKINHMTTCR